MIAFNPVVSVLFVDVRDVIKVRIISMIYVANDLAVGRCFVRTDRNGPMKADALDSLIQKGIGCLSIAPCSQAEINHLTVRINGPPKVTPFSTDTDTP